MEEQHHINGKPAIMSLSKDMILLIASLLDEQDLANWAQSCRPFYLRLYDHRVIKLKRYHTITAISAGGYHSLFAQHQSLHAAGANTCGQLGLGDTERRQRFERITELPFPVLMLATGWKHSLVLLQGGELWACGNNAFGQLGLGDTKHRFSFERIKRLPSPVLMLATGDDHTLVVLQGGDLWACGDNYYGQLGLGDTKNRDRLERIKELPSPVLMLAAASFHSLVALQGGDLWACGYNGYGQLGLGETQERQRFKRVKGLPSPVLMLAAGEMHTLVVLQGGELWACGNHDYGQLGLGDTKHRHRFERIKGLPSPVLMLAAGIRHSLVVLQGGDLWACGYNEYGQLGLGHTEDRHRFERIKGLSSPVLMLAAGGAHSQVVLQGGDLWTCGDNFHGQLGFDSQSKQRTHFAKTHSSKIPAMMRLFTNNLRTINHIALNHLVEHALSLLATEHSLHQKTIVVKKLIADCQRCDWRLIDDTLRQDVDLLTPDNLKHFYEKCRHMLNELNQKTSKGFSLS